MGQGWKRWAEAASRGAVDRVSKAVPGLARHIRVCRRFGPCPAEDPGKDTEVRPRRRRSRIPWFAGARRSLPLRLRPTVGPTGRNGPDAAPACRNRNGPHPSPAPMPTHSMEGSPMSANEVPRNTSFLPNRRDFIELGLAMSTFAAMPGLTGAATHLKPEGSFTMLCHDRRRYRDLLQGLGSEGRPADHVPSRLAAFQRRLGRADAVLPA